MVLTSSVLCQMLLFFSHSLKPSQRPWGGGGTGGWCGRLYNGIIPLVSPCPICVAFSRWVFPRGDSSLRRLPCGCVCTWCLRRSHKTFLRIDRFVKNSAYTNSLTIVFRRALSAAVDIITAARRNLTLSTMEWESVTRLDGQGGVGSHCE